MEKPDRNDNTEHDDLTPEDETFGHFDDDPQGDDEIDVAPGLADERVLGIKRKVLYPLLVGALVFVGLFYVLTKQRNDQQASNIENTITRFEEQDSKPVKSLRVGDDAPTLSLTPISGKGSVDFAGKPTLVEFMQTTCPHCQKMSPIISSALKQIPTNFVMVGAANETDEEVTKFHERSAKQALPGVAVNDRGLRFTMMYGVASYPTFYFIDGDGKVQAILAGEKPKSQIVKHLKAIQG